MHFAKAHRGSRLPELFTWMGKRINATRHLAIHIDYRGCWEPSGPEALRSDLLSSGHGWMAKMETLDLSIDEPASLCHKASLDCLLQDRLISSCCRLDTMSVSFNKDPSWLMRCPAMRHICLHLSPPPTSQKPFHDLSGMHSMYLPHLETLYLQGYESLELGCIDFRDSGRLEVVSVLDCWIDDVALPPSCKVCVSAQSCSFILHMDETRQHPLVSSASHVCLPTDLLERLRADGDYLDSDCYTDTGEYSSDEDWSDDSGADGRNFTGRLFRKEWMREEDLRKSAMGIPDMFPAMRSLRLTRPDKGLRPYYQYRDYKRCYIPSSELMEEHGSCGVSLFYMRCLSAQWQHSILRELIIEGNSLGVTIPALPSLETLLVSCNRNVELKFTDPEGLGRTITRMSVAGQQIHFDLQQQRELISALHARSMELVGDWNRCMAVHASKNNPIPTAAELLGQTWQGLRCRCQACPSCLGVGRNTL